MKELTITLTIEETNLVLEALGTLPFKAVYSLIGKIQAQAASQLNENGQAVNHSEPAPTPKTKA